MPDIVIENCSSGGHRSEPSMMELCSQGSFSDAHETTAIPMIAANMHRVMKPSQSQIWAVMRTSDSAQRIYYSIVNTFLGRMCLSGDIYSLSDEQWKLIDEGIAFYKKAADIIKNGVTTTIECTAQSFNTPVGNQLVIRQYGERSLVVAHRFAMSKPVDVSNAIGNAMGNAKGKKILAQYGAADSDFSAQAWIIG